MSLEDPQYRITPVQQAAASCTGAILTSLLVTPLDVVKIRLQAQQRITDQRCFLYCNGLMDHICGCGPGNGQKHWFQRPGRFNGTIDAFLKISRNEGIYSLWSGLGPTLVLSIPTTILYFVSYEQLRLKMKEVYNKKLQPGQEKLQPHWIPLIAGASARVFAVTVVSPLELIRTKMQSRKISYSEITQSLKLLVKQDGVFGLWRGILPTLCRDVPFSAIYWMHYETIKSFFGSDVPSFGVSFFAGGVAGAVAAVATVPFDVVKTHQQIEIGEKTLYTDTPQKTKSMIEVIQEIHRHNGFRGLFAGLVPRLVKVAPACAIMISTFEYGKVFFYRFK
ncbi:solute carrier family 25 protein Shawn-like isoform X3 [Tenebrio molitor]|uniref:solute carrier family 25 protein Shawn-like isoform X3 n=1 Tax=Tenebrio molitor TaxID=7067 RepID=UPI00362479CF